VLHPRARPLALAAGVVLLSTLASCGQAPDRAGERSSSPTVTPSASLTPEPTCEARASTTVHLIAKGAHFSEECLVFPAGKPVTIEFENLDHGTLGRNHNFSIYTLEFATRFTGDLAYPAERLTYDIPALEAGVYPLPVRHPPEGHAGVADRAIALVTATAMIVSEGRFQP
jgi:hypothetical protein